MAWHVVEAHCAKHPEAVISTFDAPNIWSSPFFQDHIAPRLMRRFAEAGSRRNFLHCARLLELAPDAAGRTALMIGFEKVLVEQLPTYLFVAALSLLASLIQIYFYGILILAISSWVGTTNHPTVRVISQIIDPYMKPFRKVIPPIGMIDISPMVAIFTLMFIRGQVLPVLSNLI